MDKIEFLKKWFNADDEEELQMLLIDELKLYRLMELLDDYYDERVKEDEAPGRTMA